MQITFRPSAGAADSSTPRLLARIVDQDGLPADLSRTDAEGAAAARFTGKTGQVFESFGERDGRVVRLALAGAGKADADDRTAALERAGAALSARYLLQPGAELEPRVPLLPQEIDEGIARLKLQALGLEIDELTDAQRQFRRSWEAFS